MSFPAFIYNSMVDKQLNSSLRLISGTLYALQLQWLPVLTNIPPPNIQRKAVCDKLLQIVENHPVWPVYQDFFNHPPPRLTSRKPICRSTIWSGLICLQPVLHLSGETNSSLSLWPTKFHLWPGFQALISVVQHGGCPLTRFDSDLFRLHSADHCAVTWLHNVAVKTFAN